AHDRRPGAARGVDDAEERCAGAGRFRRCRRLPARRADRTPRRRHRARPGDRLHGLGARADDQFPGRLHLTPGGACGRSALSSPRSFTKTWRKPAMTTTAVLEARTADFDVDDVEYLRHGDKPLLARIYKPRGVGPFPAMVECHG